MSMNGVFFVGAQLSREGLKGLLAAAGFSSIGEAGTLAEAQRRLGAAPQPAQILLVDLAGPPQGDEGELLRAIRDSQPAIKVIVLGDALSLALLAQTCPAEIDGSLLRNMSAAALLHSLHLIVSGQRILSAREAPISADATRNLTAREAQILQLLAVGSSNKAIGRDLAISHETVKVHMKALLRKLNAQNRTQAALWGLENRRRQLGAAGPRPMAGEGLH